MFVSTAFLAPQLAVAGGHDEPPQHGRGMPTDRAPVASTPVAVDRLDRECPKA
jgi:hypothetical protein